jgi:hypothetical protein
MWRETLNPEVFRDTSLIHASASELEICDASGRDTSTLKDNGGRSFGEESMPQSFSKQFPATSFRISKHFAEYVHSAVCNFTLKSLRPFCRAGLQRMNLRMGLKLS